MLLARHGGLPKIDRTIFVIRLNTSSTGPSKKALELLAQRQINVLGVLVNDVKLSESDYGYGYYDEVRNTDPEPTKLTAGAV
jgi:Mrp family chromosome partitioning ATPase